MLYNDFTQKLLRLQDVIVKNIENLSENFMRISIELPRKEHVCPVCGAKTTKIHDYHNRTIRDIDSFGDYVELVYRRRRYRCPECGKCFPEENSFVPKYHRMTMRLVSYIIHLLGNECSFSSAARSLNLSVTTIIRTFDAVKYPPAANLPAVLAIDEFKGNTGKEKYQAILTNPADGKVLDILLCRKQSELLAYMRRIDPNDRHNVKFFVSDMWKPYSDLSSVMLKNAIQIVDKYHYIRQIIWAFEKVRKNEQKKYGAGNRKLFKNSKRILTKRRSKLKDGEKQRLEAILYVSDKLRKAYYLKEQFYEVIDAEDKAAAKKRMSEWIMAVQGSDIPEYSSCVTMLLNWSEGILNSFDYPYTNGFTEGCNNKIKVLKRNAYGYRNFDRFRNRILHMFNYPNLSAKI